MSVVRTANNKQSGTITLRACRYVKDVETDAINVRKIAENQNEFAL